MFGMSAIVKGFIWAAAVEPVIQMLGLGSVFVAWNKAKDAEIDDEYDRFLKSFKEKNKKLDEAYERNKK